MEQEQEAEPDQAEEEPEQASPQPAARAPKRKQSVKAEPAEEAPRLQRRARKRNAAVAAAIEAEEWKSDADEENSEEEAGRVLFQTYPFPLFLLQASLRGLLICIPYADVSDRSSVCSACMQRVCVPL